MKRILTCVVFTLIILNLTAPAPAIALFRTHFEKMYVKDKQNSKFAKQVREKRCNLCHVPGTNNKKRNEYGIALGKLLKRENYRGVRVQKERKKVTEELNRAFDKVAKLKNKDGKTFGELIKAGKLPGGGPEAK